MDKNLLKIVNLSIKLKSSGISLVNNINLSIKQGEIFGLVGESGCGKSITALSIMRLHPPKRFQITGEIFFNEIDLLKVPEEQMIEIRGNEISMIFQDPGSSLNPVYTIGQQIMEVIILHQSVSKEEAWNKAIRQLQLVAISSPENIMKCYPHELSGGMKQRVMIAIATANNPKLLIADESTTALDVTIQAQILELMLQLRDKISTSILLITHDLGIIAEKSDRVAVMYAGTILEEADVRELFVNPLHPYTKGLLNCIPKVTEKQKYLETIPGYVPILYNYDDNACRFASRCEFEKPICRLSKPQKKQISQNHYVSCHLYS